jgi:hypothetical protein
VDESKANDIEVEPKIIKEEKKMGWTQHDGRWADNVEIVANNIPNHLKSRIKLVKGTHFGFVNKEDELRYIQMLEGINQYTVKYHEKGTKDISIMKDNELIGNIHFLHVNKTELHDPSKYYIKLYLFNFKDKESIKKVRDTSIYFFKNFAPKKMNVTRLKGLLKMSKLTKKIKKQKMYNKKQKTRRRKFRK